MTPTQAELYKRICDFKLDPPSAILPFSAKLAWEYQWTQIYTYRVIQEYKNINKMNDFYRICEVETASKTNIKNNSALS